ncbi:MAG TPA: hypothetical protein VLG50_04600 [Candidatus Saccharimonadales bacterium]|nr:hypothetical protein [Candidatus Saccharimonadales bacterium]
MKNYFLLFNLISLACYASSSQIESLPHQMSRPSSTDSVHTQPSTKVDQLELSKTIPGIQMNTYNHEGMRSNNPLSAPTNNTSVLQPSIVQVNQENRSNSFNCINFCKCIAKKHDDSCAAFGGILCYPLFILVYCTQPNSCSLLKADCQSRQYECKQLWCDCDISPTND